MNRQTHSSSDRVERQSDIRAVDLMLRALFRRRSTLPPTRGYLTIQLESDIIQNYQFEDISFKGFF